MSKIATRIFLIFSIIWGLGYPSIFRYPLYIFVPLFLILNLKKVQNIQLKAFKKCFLSTIKKFIFSKKLYFLIPIAFYTYLWQPYGLLYLFKVLIFIFVLRNIINYADIKNNDWIYKSLIISIIIVGITIPFVGQHNQYVTASPGLFPEPSHLGFSMGPVLGLLSRKKKYSFFGITGLAFFLIFAYSKSLIIGYFFSLIFSTRFNSKFKSRKLALIIICSLFILISAKAIIMFKIAGLNNNEIDYGIFGSSLVWFFWLKHSLLEILRNPLGIGPFGWLQNGLEVPLAIPECNNKMICIYSGKLMNTLNQRDMASLLAFGISSFGFIFPIYLFYLVNRICENTIKISNNYSQLEPISILLLSYICTYMFRWTGFTAGPLIGILCMMPKPHLKNIEDISQSRVK